jgi:hypothetical protein
MKRLPGRLRQIELKRRLTDQWERPRSPTQVRRYAGCSLLASGKDKSNYARKPADVLSPEASLDVGGRLFAVSTAMYRLRGCS